MSDPFAHLLTSLKNKDSASVSKETTPQSSNSPSISASSALAGLAKTDKSINDTVNSISASPLILSSKLDFSGPPLVPSNSTPNSNTADNTPPSALVNIDDDFNQLFGTDTIAAANTIQQVDQDYYGSKQDLHNNVDDALVDEVKDMEIAKLMSLGLSIEKANEFYDNDITYERYVENLKSNQKKRKDRIVREKRNGTRIEKSGLSNNADPDNNTLFSMATNFFNKGKELVDQWTSFPPEANDRLNSYLNTHEKSEDYHLPPVNDPSNGPLLEDNKVEQKLPPSNNLDEDLLTDFEKIDITKGTVTDVTHSPSPSPDILIEENPRRNEPLVEHSLLDFSEENPINSKRNEGSTLFNGSSNADFTIPISDIELSGYNEFKAKGTSLFKNGDYVNSLQEYEKSLNSLPLNHPLRIIALSNIIASQLKIGEYSKSIENSNMALELFPPSKATWNNKISKSDPERSFNDIWPKIMIRRAESFEHLESFKNALETYQELINKNFFDDRIMQGKRRCQNFMNPPPVRKSNPVEKTSTTLPPTRRPTSTPSPALSPITIDSTSEIKKLELENAKLALYDKVFERVSSWKDGKDDDIRHLLTNLSGLLTWCNWKDVPVQDLVMPKRVKITYMKAVAKTHPDKIPESLSLENKMIAENVFSTLSIAWDKFKQQNDIN
ncbi:auxilin-like protein SWA2 [Saccharomyces paradoxus]|uniref:Auxilin-like protein SWA2 n=1 Tax=Saccharomyces paradoxus TaxID=27291 RepID=A0A8B8UP52_SACPA|nr:Swa2 [Saccharomyces paradoxus]QHS72512.1 Swa2 [Saccharomyces paradoxus]